MGLYVKSFKIDSARTAQRILDKKAKLFAANETFRLISPYVPRESGDLMETVDVTPDYIHYKMPYAHRQYCGKGFHFRKDRNPKATAEWDKAAMVTQKEKLIRTMQNYFNSGR